MTQPTPLDIQKFERLPFTVEAVEVTAENINQVARWCRGKVLTEPGRARKKYILVEVKRALNDRQTQAYVGDYVLKAGSGFKIYTPKAFETSFRKKTEHMMKTVRNMVGREQAEDKVEAELDVPIEPGQLSEGGPQPDVSA